MCKNRRHILRTALLSLSVVLLASCRELPRYFAGDRPLARVGERELSDRELHQALSTGLNPADSAAYARVYIDRWVRKQLKLQEAEQLFSSDEADIDRMVEEYRQSLLIRKLEQFYVDRLVDTTYTEEEIAAYYNAHAADFKLDRTIVQGTVVRFPKEYRQQRRLRELLASNSGTQRQDLHDLCLKHEFGLNDYAAEWIDYDDFLSLLPTVRSQNYDALLAKPGVQEMTDNRSGYLFRIDAVRRAGEPVPLERLRPTIRRVLFNQRQQQVIREHEESLYRHAAEEDEVRLFVDAEEPEDGADDAGPQPE